MREIGVVQHWCKAMDSNGAGAGGGSQGIVKWLGFSGVRAVVCIVLSCRSYCTGIDSFRLADVSGQQLVFVTWSMERQADL